MGTAPPARPVPDPRATNGTPNSLATCTTARTSSVDSAKHTTAAWPAMFDASRRYRLTSAAPSRTWSGRSRERSRSTSGVVPVVAVTSWRSTAPTLIARPSPLGLAPLGLALAHDDHTAALDRHTVDVHLIAGADVLVERHETTFPTGVQLVLGVLHHLTTLADGIDDVS